MPFPEAAVHVIVDWASPLEPTTPDGAVGTAPGETAVEAAEASLVPTRLVEVTVNVYGVPLVSPVTVHGEPVQLDLVAARVGPSV